MRPVRLATLVLLAPSTVLAHVTAPGESTIASDPWSAWTWDPLIVASIVVPAALYGAGLVRLWGRAGRGHGVRGSQAAAFALGIVALIVALVSPLDPLGEELFSAHMLQHLLLMAVAAPLLVLGAPEVVTPRALPDGTRRLVGRGLHRARPLRSLWRALSSAPSAFLLHGLAMWAWHVPILYEEALRSPPVHLLEHASFLGTGLLFWWAVFRSGAPGHAGHGTALVVVFLTMLHSGLLGVLLLLSPDTWYVAHEARVDAWGLTPLEDQQLAGLVMWVPGGAAYVAAAIEVSRSWLEASSRAVARRERLLPRSARVP